jgi:hypothetical protein
MSTEIAGIKRFYFQLTNFKRSNFSLPNVGEVARQQ